MHLEIRPGEILTTGIVHMDQKKAKKKTILKRIFSSGKGSGKKEQDLKYLQCFDSENREIMLPLITSGVFSPVGDQTTPNVDAVYSLHDLISAFNLPIKAQLIHSSCTPDGTPSYDSVPSGVLLLERLTDAEKVLVGRHPYIEGDSDTFEIPLLSDLTVIKEKRRKTKKPSLVDSESAKEDNEVDLSNYGQIDLPIRVKEKKNSMGIFEKLSVRSKARKERASLKALHAEGVFSSRLSKSDLNFSDTFNADVDSGNNEETDTSDTANAVKENDTNDITEKQAADIENGYSVSSKRPTMKERDLPPVPVKTRTPKRIYNSDKENHYEELPIAPKPPPAGKSPYKYSSEDREAMDDGYMTPARFREMNESQGTEDFDVIVKRKPPTAPRDSLRYTRARKVKSEYATLPSTTFETDPGENIDNLFDFTEGEADSSHGSVYERRRLVFNHGQMVRENSRDRGGGKVIYIDDNRRFNDDSALESKSLSGFAKLKSRSQKSLNNVESNATIRSHNVRKMRTAMEVFNFSDSMKDLREPSDVVVNGNGEPTYGRVIDNDRIKSYVYGQPSPYSRGGRQYVESEPGYSRKYVRSSSIAALNDAFPKHGDDSAISCGEYGFQGESEYSYSEYSEWHDDGWIPPDDITSLSVLEVSKSLRYIGMKDRVVIRFAREQIDGNMLCSLDKKLLKEGFPELNALDIKKVMDFIRGWRPKK